MFVHIGKENMVHSKDIIMILDYEKIKKSSYPSFLKTGNKEFHKLIKDRKEKEMKTIIITTKDIFFSPIASVTLAKRIAHK